MVVFAAALSEFVGVVLQRGMLLHCPLNAEVMHLFAMRRRAQT